MFQRDQRDTTVIFQLLSDNLYCLIDYISAIPVRRSVPARQPFPNIVKHSRSRLTEPQIVPNRLAINSFSVQFAIED